MTTPAVPRVQTFIDLDKAAADTQIAEIGGMVDPSEYSRQPGLVYFYTFAAAKAERQVSKIKLQIEMAEANADTKIRDDARLAGEKMTADAIKAAVRKDNKVTRLDVDLLEAQEILATIKGVCNALSHKKDMLVMRGHMTRDEIKARLQVEDSLPDGMADRQARVKELLAKRSDA